MYISLSTQVMDQRLQIIANALTNSTTTTTTLTNSSSSLATYVNSGYFTVVIYSGTIPTNADTSLGTDNIPLATISIPNNEVQAPSNGTLVINGEPLTSTPATSTGTATFARIYNEAGNVVMDCDVGISGTTFILVSVNVTIGLVLVITSMSFSEYAS